jgi:nitrous oxidase accessory protein
MGDGARSFRVLRSLWLRSLRGLALTAAGAVAMPAPAAEFDLHAAVAGAADGAKRTVPPGTYAGPVIIERSITLVAGGEVVIDGGGEGDVITIEAPDVTVRGFHIRNTGTSLDRENAGITGLAPRAVIEDNVLEGVLFGIYLKEALHSVIRGNVIGGKDLEVQRRGDGIRIWQCHGTVIEGNTIADSRDAVMWFSDDVHLRGNRITGGRYGLHFMYSHENLIEDNHLEGNSVGAFLMYSKNLVLRRNAFVRNRGPSGFGIGLKDMDGAVAEDNHFIGNRIGVSLDNSPSSMRSHQEFSRNVFAFNDIGIAFLPSVKRNRFVDNTFFENIEQVAVLGSGNFGGNDFTIDGHGNFWSDYRGYDLDGDGVGDLPYESVSLFENLMDREPKMRLFLYSPAQQAIEMAARTFPIVRPRPKMSDSAPLMSPPPPVHTPARERGRGDMAALAAGLLGIAALAVVGAGRSFGARGGAAASAKTGPVIGGAT